MLLVPWCLVIVLSFSCAVKAQLKFIKALAGTGTATFSGENAPPSSAALRSPSGLWMDSNGDIFLAHTANHRVRRISASTNKISTVAGSGSASLSGDGGAATSAGLYNPMGVWVSSVGEVFIADTENCRIRTMTSASSSAVINTFAGSRLRGLWGYTFDNGPGTSARMGNGFGITGDSMGNLYVSEYDHFRIRKIDAITGKISVYAGTGGQGFNGDSAATLTRLNRPTALAIDSIGDLYFCDSANYRIRKMSAKARNVTTITGNGISTSVDGPVSSASLTNECRGVWVNSIGDVFFTDIIRVRKIDIALGNVSTIAGTGSRGSPTNNVAATSSKLGTCVGITGDSAGNIYVSDASYFRIYKISQAGILTFIAGSGTSGFDIYNKAPTSARIGAVLSLFLDSIGDLYMGDSTNNRSLVMNVFNQTSPISTVVGTGVADLSPDGTLAQSASVGHVTAIWKSTNGDLALVDKLNNRVRRLNLSQPMEMRTISTLLGNGVAGYCGESSDYSLGPTSSSLSLPQSVIGDSAGAIFISDTNNHVILKVQSGIVTVFAGKPSANGGTFSGDGVPATSANLNVPSGLWLTTDGALLIADSGNHRIRSISLTGNNTIRTVMGNGIASWTGDGGLR